MGGSTPKAPKKRMKRAMKQPPTPDQVPPTASDMVDNTMMDLLLDMSSWMQAMEEYVAQQKTLTHMGNQGPVLDMSRDRARLDVPTTTSSARVSAGHVGSAGTITPWMADDMNADRARLDGAATTCSTQVAAGCLETSGTIAPRVADDIVPETPRRELARHLRQAPLLADISTDDSRMGQGPARRRKKDKPLKSGKVRTADYIVIKRITWPNELGGEPMTYEHISISQFVTGYLSLLDMVKMGGETVHVETSQGADGGRIYVWVGACTSLSWRVAPAEQEWKGRVAGC